MNRAIGCLLLLFSLSSAYSQKDYFIYLQSEAEQPFFVKMGEKIYSSASSGYLIISKLKDTSYNFKIGFPQNKWPEQEFSVDIKSKDQGFLLKNFGEKGWGLFDLQTMGIRMATGNTAKNKRELKEVSAFTEILSKATNDPSLKEKPVFAVIKEEEKPVDVQPAIVKEETISVKEQPVADHDSISESLVTKEEKPAAVKEEPVAIHDSIPESLTKKEEKSAAVKEEIHDKEVSTAVVQEEPIQKQEIKTAPQQEYKKSVIVKKSESSTTEGFGLTFVDEYEDGQKDTIQILIPNPKSILVVKDDQAANDKKFIDITELPKEDKLTNNCGSIASENDFLRLRKKMAGQKTDESMISEAEKVFKTKCFTIVQVKNLGNLFLNEAGKFQFYEAAYPHSSDKDDFPTLQAEFKDNYFIHRFKNLVKAGNK